MGLKSDKDKATAQLFSQYQNLNTTVDNPFKSMQLTFKPLGLGELDTRTEKYFGEQETALRQLLAQKRAEDLRGLTQRLINQNIAGGLREALSSRVSSEYAGNLANQLTNLRGTLAGNKLQNLLTAQEQARLYDLLTMQLLGQKTNVDFSNIAYNLNKLNALQSIAREMDDTTWLDDVLSIVNAGANVAKAIYGGGKI